MSVSKRAMGVEGFIQQPRSFPSEDQLYQWASTIEGKVLEAITVGESDVLFKFKKGKVLVKKSLIDEAPDQGAFLVGFITSSLGRQTETLMEMI